MISTLKELQSNKKLRLRYLTDSNGFIEEDFDLVVLSVGLKPNKEVVKLAGKLGLQLNRYSFCEPGRLSGVGTSKEGVYVAGAFSTPLDVPETVMQASAAAGEAAVLLSQSRNTLVKYKEYPAEPISPYISTRISAMSKVISATSRPPFPAA